MRDLAAKSIVLLKNEDKALPIDLTSEKFKTIAVIGPNAKARLVSGGGSASLKASYFITPYEGIVNAVTTSGQDIEIAYHEGVQGTTTMLN